MPANPRLDPLFRRPGPWLDERVALRRIVTDFPLVETLKWRQACYVAHGGNVAIIGATQAFCSLGFFRGALLDNPDGLLVAPGKNTRAARRMCFTSVADITAREAAIRRTIAAAIDIHASGQAVDLALTSEITYPPELTTDLAADPALRAAFDSLTPGRRRGWILLFAEARRPATRAARIARATPAILAGKGRHDR